MGSITLFFMLAVFLILRVAEAGDKITDAEMDALPPYCKAKMRTHNPVEEDIWKKQLGFNNWTHIHHYCGGLVDVKHAKWTANIYEKRSSIKNAIWQFDYMIRNADPNFFLMPNFHHGKGEVLMLQGNKGEAFIEFQKALEISPDFIPAVLSMLDMYEEQKNSAGSLILLEKVLMRNPSHKLLRKKFALLGGDLSVIPDVVAQEMQAPVIVDSSVKAQDTSASLGVSEKVEGSKSDNTGKEFGIGMPGNPWCRFCPNGEPAAVSK
jgi:tetratricopeptide (TPR) repeat protein